MSKTFLRYILRLSPGLGFGLLLGLSACTVKPGLGDAEAFGGGNELLTRLASLEAMQLHAVAQLKAGVGKSLFGRPIACDEDTAVCHRLNDIANDPERTRRLKQDVLDNPATLDEYASLLSQVRNEVSPRIEVDGQAKYAKTTPADFGPIFWSVSLCAELSSPLLTQIRFHELSHKIKAHRNAPDESRLDDIGAAFAHFVSLLDRAAGKLDRTLGDKGHLTAQFAQGWKVRAGAMAVDRQGRILMAGGLGYPSANGSVTYSDLITRFSSDTAASNNTPDGTWNGTGVLHRAAPQGYLDATGVCALAPQVVGNNEKIVVMSFIRGANQASKLYLRRLNEDGSIDSAFTPLFFNSVTDAQSRCALAVKSDGTIFGGVRGNGSAAEATVFRLRANGTLDFSFNGTGWGEISSSYSPLRVDTLAVTADGGVIAAGLMGDQAGVIRYGTDGKLVTSFADAGVLTIAEATPLHVSARLADEGQLLVAVSRRAKSETLVKGFAAATGSALPGAPLVLPFSHTQMEATPSHQWIIAGYAMQSDGNYKAGVARLNSDGSSDSRFQSEALPDMDSHGVGALALDGDGRIVLGAWSLGFGLRRQHIFRLWPGAH